MTHWVRDTYVDDVLDEWHICEWLLKFVARIEMTLIARVTRHTHNCVNDSLSSWHVFRWLVDEWHICLWVTPRPCRLRSSIDLAYIWQFPLKLAHPRNPPNPETEILRYNQIRPKSQFECVPRDTEKSEFLDLVDVVGVAISVENC